jgi:serine protease Do
MKRWLALAVCLLIDGATLQRVLAQQPLPKPGGYLGVGVADIDEDRAKALKLPDAQGVEINVVTAGSPALKAGLLKGDVVLEFNGQRVEGTEQFIRMVRETPVGHKITLRILRNGAPQTVSAMVGPRPAREWLTPEGTYTLPDGTYTFTMPPMPAMPAMPTIPRMPRVPMDTPRPRLMWRNGSVGIEAESLSGQLAEYFGVKDGVLIRSVAKDSPAEKGGLKAGDVVVKVNGEAVTSPGEISSEVHGANAKRAIPFAVMRNHHELTMNVTVSDGWENLDSEER